MVIKNVEGRFLSRKAIIVCLDGCEPEYIQKSDVPNIRK